MSVVADTKGVTDGDVEPTITLRSYLDTATLRLGIWFGAERLAGWTVPRLPAHLIFTINRGRATGMILGESRPLGGRLLDWDGVRPPKAQRFPQGAYTLTLDQEPEHVVPVTVDVSFKVVGF